MNPEDMEILERAIQRFTVSAETFKDALEDRRKTGRPITINVHAGGLGTTIVLLILFTILLGFAFIRTQNRLDGLYDRLDAIYMMAPSLRPEKINEHHHPERPPAHVPSAVSGAERPQHH